MKQYTIAVLGGDGIGPDVTAEAERVLRAVADRFGLRLEMPHFPIGAMAVAAAGSPLPAETRAAVVRADAVLLGAVGDPSLDQHPASFKPGMDSWRSGPCSRSMPIFARSLFPPPSPTARRFGRSACGALDLLIVRELTGGCTTASRGARPRSRPSIP